MLRDLNKDNRPASQPDEDFVAEQEIWEARAKDWPFDLEQLARRKEQKIPQGMPDPRLTATQQVINAAVTGKGKDIKGHRPGSKQEDPEVIWSPFSFKVLRN